MKIWKIFNVSTPQKGTRLRDEFSKPLVLDDPRFSFLERVIVWIETWEATTKANKASLTRPTSLRHTCISLPLIVRHLTNNCSFSYVLTSFLQNDALEHNFGLYRQMSGTNYHISYCQILESERRLKVSSVLKLCQSSAEQISVQEFIQQFSNFSVNDLDSSAISLQTQGRIMNQLPDLEAIDYDTQTLQALAFMTGFDVNQFYRRSNKCPICLDYLTTDKEFMIDLPKDSRFAYLEIVDRGSLKWPSDTILRAVVILWKIFVGIDIDISLKKELVQGPSKQILVSLAIQHIENNR